MDELLLNWLAADTAEPLILNCGSDVYFFLRVEKAPGFDYLYYQHQYREPALVRGDSFKYAGLYYHGDGQIYNAQYDLRHITGEDSSMEKRGTVHLLEMLKKEVRQLVEARIRNDRSRLQITELKNERNLRDLESYRTGRARGLAREIYLAGDELEDICFTCRYVPEIWTEDSLLEYIADPDGYTQREADSYLAEAQEDILLQFIENDALAVSFQAILDDPENPIHTVKKIMDTMNRSPAKTVNVTVCIDGTELTFKTEAHDLRRDCKNTYSSWCIAAADRRKFEETFGRHRDYGPKDIIRITYGKSVLYEAEK